MQSQGELTIAGTGKDPVSGKLVTQAYRVEGPVLLFLNDFRFSRRDVREHTGWGNTQLKLHLQGNRATLF